MFILEPIHHSPSDGLQRDVAIVRYTRGRLQISFAMPWSEINKRVSGMPKAVGKEKRVPRNPVVSIDIHTFSVHEPNRCSEESHLLVVIGCLV